MKYVVVAISPGTDPYVFGPFFGDSTAEEFRQLIENDYDKTFVVGLQHPSEEPGWNEKLARWTTMVNEANGVKR